MSPVDDESTQDKEEGDTGVSAKREHPFKRLGRGAEILFLRQIPGGMKQDDQQGGSRPAPLNALQHVPSGSTWTNVGRYARP
jgi:hypothetical protein